jgi:hypothetical protein
LQLLHQADVVFFDMPTGGNATVVDLISVARKSTRQHWPSGGVLPMNLFDKTALANVGKKR